MDEQNKKLELIKEIIDNFKLFSMERPGMYGGFEDIEANFWIVDNIDLILKYGVVKNYRELSWSSFLAFKSEDYCIVGQAYKILKERNEDSSDSEFKKLREEYYKWREIKLEYIMENNESRIIELLEKSNYYQSRELLRCFTKYPSKRAIEIYLLKVNNDYLNNPDITIGIAKMGDEKIFKWAKEQINKDLYNNERDLALKCIAASPLAEANNIAKKIIQTENVEDIKSLLHGFCMYTNKHNLNRLEQIMSINNLKDELRADLSIALGLLAVKENDERAAELKKKLYPDMSI
jgi:hypothetical protein